MDLASLPSPSERDPADHSTAFPEPMNETKTANNRSKDVDNECVCLTSIQLFLTQRCVQILERPKIVLS
jgi:hypothetical protein